MHRRGGRAPLALAASLLAVPACKQSTPEKSATPVAAAVPEKILVGSTLPLTGSEARIGGFHKGGYGLGLEGAEKAGGRPGGGESAPRTTQIFSGSRTPATPRSLSPPP